MAGGGTPTPTKGGKRPVDFIVNLVPTIDLLSVLISFLLITAVWTQLARINTDQVLQRAADKPTKQIEERKDLKILLNDKGILIRFTGEDPAKIDKGEGLLKRFRETVDKYKKRAAAEQKVIVSAEDSVAYSLLIEVMDVCLNAGLHALAVGDPSSFE